MLGTWTVEEMLGGVSITHQIAVKLSLNRIPPPTKSRARVNSDQNRRRNSYTNADFVYEIFHSYTKSWNPYTKFVYDFVISYTKFVYEGRYDISSIRNVVSQNFVIRIFHSYTKSDLGSEFVYEILVGRRNPCRFHLF